MSNLMIVTVGTSLFQSASWDEANDDYKEKMGSLWKQYATKWAIDQEGKGLRSPDYRKKNDGGLEEYFQKKLIKPDNANTWCKWLAGYEYGSTQLMRYSAELGTILRFAEYKFSSSWKEGLNEYEIVFLHDNDETEPTYAAAMHLRAYLQKITGNSKIRTDIVPHFSSLNPAQIVEGLSDFFNHINDALGADFDKVDVVISGGYKIYSLVCARFIGEPDFRIIYQNEQSPDIVVHEENYMMVGSQRLDFPS